MNTTLQACLFSSGTPRLCAFARLRYYVLSAFIHCLVLGGVLFITPESHTQLFDNIDFVVLEKAGKAQSSQSTGTQIPPVQQKKISSPPTVNENKSPASPLKEALAQNQASDARRMGETTISLENFEGREPRNATEEYLAHLRQHVRENNHYPTLSRRLGEEGVVVLRLTLNRNGSLMKLEVVQQCPYHRLNDAAFEGVTRAAPFGEFPAELPFEQWRITMPVRFQLSAG